jgi:hypothetical protein
VAADHNGPIYGAGRGMLGDALTRLFLPQYVQTIDFDVFAGVSKQGEYTDWGAYSLLVLVNEARDTSESARWSAKNTIYEHLKATQDPRPMLRKFSSKYGKPFTAWSFFSTMIFSNNPDAFQLPPEDRRFSVLSNIAKLPPERAAEFQAWMDKPENIAALWRELAARDIDRFDPYTPLATEAKHEMQQLSFSEVEVALNEVRATLGPKALFVGSLIVPAVQTRMDTELSHGEKNFIARTWLRRMAKQVPSTLQNLRVDFAGREQRVLCWRDYTGPKIERHDVAAAAVEHSATVLFGGGAEGFGTSPQ